MLGPNVDTREPELSTKSNVDSVSNPTMSLSTETTSEIATAPSLFTSAASFACPVNV